MITPVYLGTYRFAQVLLAHHLIQYNKHIIRQQANLKLEK